ncbi:hypothetical protein M404DRAFT_28061 [Pisolithus tinctorius Marx 270]|uniref:DUF6830 domain-containing protein n=1 Tax=Pisolithus tinctorius Marx 270 TaxID=870435 RepID=A0A0C3IZ78_PISTI|nr:hypothetical protein M404DRAFT_28061 [Pisolithus tinctorius Marx 270]
MSTDPDDYATHDYLDFVHMAFDTWGPTTDDFEGAAKTFGLGPTFMDKFNSDQFSNLRASNLYYPFNSHNEWELASWLLRSGLSMRAIDSFLSLSIIQLLNISFHTARALCGLAELLPGGPCWHSMEITPSQPTKHPVHLYWHNPLECIAWLLNHPLFSDQLDFVLRRVYKMPEKLCRVYTEWMTTDDAWRMQSQLPSGVTLLGMILSSDKMNITTLCGGRVAHPLLISLANIKMSTRLKLSSNSFMLAALLPVPKFVHKNKCMHGLLEDRLIHECLDIILEPVKQAAKLGIMLPDSLGHMWYCFMPIAGYIANTPKAAMLAAVGGKTSLITMAMYKQFGDPFQHEPRTASTTLAQLAAVKSKVHPTNIQVFFCEAQCFRLSGVSDPFWRDIPLSCPSTFITLEPLHHLHKEFWDHDMKWCINAVGEAKIDFRFSVLQPTAGFHHFKGGVAKLKQVTGRVHRDVQRYIISVIAGAAPPKIITAIRVLMDFRYRVQAYRIDDDNLRIISSALDKFHAHKQLILNHELMQSIVPSVKCVGVTIQWTADVTEHAHVSEIKTPASASNNNNYNPQICRYLDRAEKCRTFELATSLYESKTHSHGHVEEKSLEVEDGSSDDGDSEISDHEEANLVSKTPGPTRPVTDYFAISVHLRTQDPDSIPFPLHSFITDGMAINLSYDPPLRCISVDGAAEKFGLLDLRAALVDFLNREKVYGPSSVHTISGQHWGSSSSTLPFTDLQVWYKMWLQNTAIHDITDILPAQTLFCSPPCETWTLGHYDAAIINVDPCFKWPESGLKAPSPDVPFWQEGAAEDVTHLRILRRTKRANGQHLGNVIPLSQVRAFAHLIPRFGQTADNRLTAYNSFKHSSEFYLNKYFDNNMYFALSHSDSPPI